jgi:large subunit ribosomal protein L13
MIIDATDLILGRLGTYAAKKALLGEKIDIVNCESAVVSGSKDAVLQHYKKSHKRGIPAKGPFFYRMPDRFVKRSIRGMLPYKKERGEKAFKNIKCHIGVPENLKSQKIDSTITKDIQKLPNLEYVRVRDICVDAGAKLE